MYDISAMTTMPPLLCNPPTSRYEMGTFDFDSFSQAYHTQSAPSQPHHMTESTYGHRAAHQAPIQKPPHTYVPSNGPLLPPLRVPERGLDTYQQTSRSKQSSNTAQPKEEKIGGVTAHLDYVMDEMVDFVSEMAQGMYDIFSSKICLADIDMTRSVLSSDASVPPNFRKFVSQVLTSTRLPSSTILLSLHYLAVRMTILSTRRSYTFDGGDIFSMLTTALLLGSKFLDDNTFQNKSWSDVSGLHVSTLNVLESEWLRDIKWDLHFDPSDPKGFDLWRRRWQSHQARKIDSLADSMKQTCLETKYHRQQSLRQPLSPGFQYPPQTSDVSTVNAHSDGALQWQTPRYDAWTPSAPQYQYSPPSAPETGPTTPDHGMSYDFGYGLLPPAFTSLKMAPALQVVPSNAPQPGYMTPYTPQCNQYNSYSKYCGCQYCLSSNERYMTGPRYGPSVAA